jgi:hypothetical protein
MAYESPLSTWQFWEERAQAFARTAKEGRVASTSWRSATISASWRTRLLIQADHHRAVRPQIHADEVAGLGFELKVGAELERLNLGGLDFPLSSDHVPRPLGDPQLRGQEPCRPPRDPHPLEISSDYLGTMKPCGNLK